MKRIMPWVPMPTRWVLSGDMAKHFTWSGSEGSKGASAIAALQLWVTLVTQADRGNAQNMQTTHTAEVTYDALMESAGLSRQLVAAGLRGLEEAALIEIEKVGRRSIYHIPGFAPGEWCKLPARALYNGHRIAAFHNFRKRAVCELHAMKLYLYYAAVRDRKNPYSMCSFETINTRTGVPEKGIPKANSVLLNAGLVVNISKDKFQGTKWKEPNKYFLAGYRDLFIGQNLSD
ncbi:DNA-binding protein [Halopseudomonas aestusnigri]|uniref:DNA-binding protein n=1 Tax=Halopseudomonas aestusnigri TaxID=857252 RepID=UPI00255494F2|nr:DNA-binding protein [Halopseudomonas aestusnigri]MDL2199386.1 DNA-binding protein [Halopseudomonas aestusnigri]